MIKYKDVEIKNNIKEFTIREFEEISAILNNESLENVEKYMDVLEKLGIHSNLLNEMTDDEFFELISKFEMTTDLTLTPKFEHEGHTYVAYEEEFKLGVKALSIIEKAIAKNPNKYLAKTLAVIFKRSDLSGGEHYVDTHLKSKEKIFQELPATLAYPYLVYVVEKINNKFKNAVSEELA